MAAFDVSDSIALPSQFVKMGSSMSRRQFCKVFGLLLQRIFIIFQLVKMAARCLLKVKGCSVPTCLDVYLIKSNCIFSKLSDSFVLNTNSLLFFLDRASTTFEKDNPRILKECRCSNRVWCSRWRWHLWCRCSNRCSRWRWQL